MTRLAYMFRGCIVPVLTPFKNDRIRSLNLPVVPKYAEYLADNGVKGILVNGTTGEGMTMSVTERKDLAESWVDAVKTTKQHLMIQVGGAPLPDVVSLAKHAESIGVDSVLCLPELYYKPQNSKKLVEYMKRVADAAPRTPLLYYHYPGMSNVNINMVDFLNEVADNIPSFVGIKFTSTNLEEGKQAIHVDNNKYVIFFGANQIIAAGLALGMDSAIISSMNLFPLEAFKILEANSKGDSIGARKSQEKLTNNILAISKHGTWIETLKAAMPLLTPIDVGPPRPPFFPLSKKSVESVIDALKNLDYKIQC